MSALSPRPLGPDPPRGLWRVPLPRANRSSRNREGAKSFVGPELTGLIGRKPGSAPNYNYSDANKESGITWDEAALKDYLANPKAKIPGTKMIFAGLPKEGDRDKLFAYLAQFDADGKKK